MSSGGIGSEAAERFRIYDDQLSKFDQLREELNKKDKLISDLQKVVNSNTHLKISNIKSPVTPVGEIIIYLQMLFIDCNYSFRPTLRLMILKRMMLI